MSFCTSRTSSVSNMDDSSRRRPLLAHEREKDSSLASGDWKSSIEERSPVISRRSPVYDKRYSFDDEKSRYEDKQTSSNEKRSSYGERPAYTSSYRSLYTLNDQRNYDEDKKPTYNKKDLNDDNDDDDKRTYGKKSFDDKRSSHDRKSFNEKRSSYDKTSFDDNESSAKRDSYDKRTFSDKRDSHDKMTEKKSLYDDRKNFYGVDKKPVDERSSFNESRSVARKGFPFIEKKSLYDDKSSFYDKTKTVGGRKSPVDDWKSQAKDKKATNEKYDRKSLGSNRKSSDEEWELTDSIRQSNDRRSPVRERKPTVDIWRPKSERITSGDDKKSDGDWNSGYRRLNKKWDSADEQRKSAAEKVSGEDWDSPNPRSSNIWKSSGDQRRTADERKLTDKEWESYQRSNNDRKSFSGQRKSMSEKLSDDKWDSSIKSSTDRLSFNDHKKSTSDRLSDEDWDSPAHRRSASNRSIDQRRSGARDSSFDRKSLEEEHTSSVQERLSLNDKRARSGPRKSPEEVWDYSDRHKPFSDSKTSCKDKKSSDTWKSYDKKSFGDDRKLSDEEWDPTVHRKSSIDKKSMHDRKSEEWKSAEEEKSMTARHRLSGSDRKTCSNDKKPYLPDISHILDLIDKVKLRNEEVMTDALCNVEQEIQHCLSHPEYTRVLIMKIVDRSREDQQFAIRAAALFGIIHNLKFGDLSVKAVLLRCVQHYLEEKEHERGEEFQVFNSIFFLSELYYHLRINNLPISILGEALLNHIEPLLQGEEAEFELLATCIIVNGSVLLQNQSVTLNKLIGTIRSVLIKEALSTKCRGWLLLVIELVSREFAPLLPETCKWYRSLLGSTTFEKFERLKPLSPDRQSRH